MNGHVGEQVTDFMKRNNSVISLRKLQATSLARATAVNRPVVKTFFLENTVKTAEKHKLGPELIYNIDESGLPYSSQSCKNCYQRK